MDAVGALMYDFLSVNQEEDKGRLMSMRREVWAQLPKL